MLSKTSNIERKELKAEITMKNLLIMQENEFSGTTSIYPSTMQPLIPGHLGPEQTRPLTNSAPNKLGPYQTRPPYIWGPNSTPTNSAPTEIWFRRLASSIIHVRHRLKTLVPIKNTCMMEINACCTGYWHFMIMTLSTI